MTKYDYFTEPPQAVEWANDFNQKRYQPALGKYRKYEYVWSNGSHYNPKPYRSRWVALKIAEHQYRVEIRKAKRHWKEK